MRIKTKKRELSQKLCEIMGWSDHWAVHNMPLNADRLQQLILRLEGVDRMVDVPVKLKPGWYF